MASNEWTFPEPDGSKVVPYGKYEHLGWRGSLRDRDLQGIQLWRVTLRDVDFRGADLEGATFQDVVIEQADLRGARLVGVKKLETVVGLRHARFDDNTVLDGVDLEGLARQDPVVRTRLKRIRYAGSLRRTSPGLYWPWQLSCACGRSWVRLLVWGLLLVVLFSFVYSCGQAWAQCKWLPHLVSECSACGELTPWHLLQFSAMTFVGFNMPYVVWSDSQTGFWVAAEAWLGLAFLGIFVTVVAVQVASRE